MSSNIPTVRQIAWMSLIPQLMFMGFVILIWYFLGAENPIINGTVTYLIISFSVRRFILRDHHAGIQLIKQEEFRKAIPVFEKSYLFLKKNDWLDKYRYLTLLSSSKISYREIALNNIAFCYGQIGDAIKAKEFYQQTLSEFPDSGVAKAALRLLDSIDQKSRV